MSGVLTQQDAKIGQLASPGTPLVSIMGNGGFEVDAGVSDTDVGKLAVGDKVSMTLDAFPNETFAGSVFYIAPAETNTQGVITYLIKISFDTPDPRLKSGLTANVDIQAKQDDNVLILPQYAILQNDSGTFVETLVGKTATTTPVTLGISGPERECRDPFRRHARRTSDQHRTQDPMIEVHDLKKEYTDEETPTRCACAA